MKLLSHYTVLHLSKSVNSVNMQVMDVVSHIVITFLFLMNINAQPENCSLELASLCCILSENTLNSHLTALHQRFRIMES